MALVNRTALLEYDVAGPVVIHERAILQHVVGDEHVVLTPDRDIYIEEMSVTNDDLRSFRLRPAPGRLPPGVAQAQVYGLPAFTNAEMAGFRAEAARVAAAEVAARGVPAAAPGAVVPVANQPVAPAAAAVVTVSSPGVLQWLAAEACGGYNYGDVVSGVGVAPRDGARAVHALADGTEIFVQCVDGGKLAEFFAKPSACDPRILGVHYNPVGTPERSLSEVSALCKEQPVKWILPGPRTAKWCVTYLTIEGLGFEAHHERMRTLCKLEPNSWGIQEHFQLSMTLRHAIQIDQLDAYNLAFVEVMFRRLQTIEYSHSERAREAESRSVGGKLSLEEQQTFGGLVRHAGTLMICPALLDHVKAEVEKEVGLQKNMRKIREEREAARKSSNKKKGGDENP